MTAQFGRKLVLDIGTGGGAGVRVEGLRVEFDVKATRTNYPNTGTIKIYNLAEGTRQRIKDKGTNVVLNAGYGENVGAVMKGNIRTVNHTKNGQDIVTNITVGDGDTAYQTSMANETILPGDTDPENLIKKLAGGFGADIPVGQIIGMSGLPKSNRPVVVNGNIKDELTKLGRKHDFEWSIQNGIFETVKNDQSMTDVTVLSSESGMLGSPTITEKGIKVKCLLNPRLRPNRVIQVISDFADAEGEKLTKRDTDLGGGFFRIDQIGYSGNNMDGEFVCNIEGVRMQNGRVV